LKKQQPNSSMETAVGTSIVKGYSCHNSKLITYKIDLQSTRGGGANGSIGNSKMQQVVAEIAKPI